MADQGAGLDAPPAASRRSFADVLQATMAFQKVDIPVHAPAFTDKGASACFFSDDEINISMGPIQYTVVAKTPYGRPAFPEIRAHVQQRCKLSGSFVISSIDQKHLLFRFALEDDFLRVLLRESLLVMGKVLKFYKWTPSFRPDADPSSIPVWVDLPGLPINLYQESFVRSIACNIGRVLQVANDTVRLINTEAARVCVELDLLRPKVDKIWIGMGDFGYWQAVVYPMIPAYCSTCKKLGHAKESCSSKQSTGPLESPNVPAPNPIQPVRPPRTGLDSVAANQKKNTPSLWQQVTKGKEKVSEAPSTGAGDSIPGAVVSGKEDAMLAEDEAVAVRESLVDSQVVNAVAGADKGEGASSSPARDSLHGNVDVVIAEVAVQEDEVAAPSKDEACNVQLLSPPSKAASMKPAAPFSDGHLAGPGGSLAVEGILLNVADSLQRNKNTVGVETAIDASDLTVHGANTSEGIDIDINGSPADKFNNRADIAPVSMQLRHSPRGKHPSLASAGPSGGATNVVDSGSMQASPSSREQHGEYQQVVNDAPTPAMKENNMAKVVDGCGLTTSLDQGGGAMQESLCANAVEKEIPTSPIASPGQLNIHVASYKAVLQTPQATADLVAKDVSSSSSGRRKIISQPSRKGGVRICLPATRVRSPSPPPLAVNPQIQINKEAVRAVMEQSRAENIFMPGYTFPSGDSDDQDDDEDTFYDERCRRRPGLRPRGVLRRKHSYDDLSLEF